LEAAVAAAVPVVVAAAGVRVAEVVAAGTVASPAGNHLGGPLSGPPKLSLESTATVSERCAALR